MSTDEAQIRVVVLGRKQVCADALRWMNADRRFRVQAVVTDSHLAGSPTAAAARELGLSVVSRQELSHDASTGVIKPDLVVSILYWRRLSGALLFPEASLGVINFHPAPLPEYKGCGGYNFAILDRCSSWASSAHYVVDESIDSGPIIDVRPFAICPDTATAQSVERLSMDALGEQVREVLGRIPGLGSRLPARPNTGGKYISRADMEAAKEILPGDDVDRKARAFFFPPYEGAWTRVNGTRCTVVTESILESLAAPGTTHLRMRRSVPPPGSGVW